MAESKHLESNSYGRKPRGINFDPRRLETLAMGILDTQGNKCFECGEPLKYEDATKRSHSFDIICHPCYNKPSAVVFTMDDIDHDQTRTFREHRLC